MAKVLIVENDDDVRPMLASLCRVWGHDATEAEEGAEGMSCFWHAVSEGEPFGYIILDLAMPTLDGLSMAERIRRVEKVEPIPRARILGFTGFKKDLLSGETLKRADLDDLMEKPGVPEEIRKFLET